MTLLQEELTSPTYRKNDDISTGQFNELIIEAIQDKKGKDLIKLDLRQVHDAPADFFIICHGDSDTQVKAIAKNVAREVKEKTGELPSHMEGQSNGTWVLVDFFTVVVHVFYKDTRKFYNLEGLWSDAHITEYNNL